MKWIENLLNRNELIKEILERGVEYRHGRKAIRVSDIAEQYFCEAKVENEYVYGEVEKDEILEGKK